MANLNESPQWEDGIYQIEETDVVRGGDPLNGGISNLQGLQLANRTRFLYDFLGRKQTTINKIINADTTLTANDLYNTHIIIQNNQSGKLINLDLTDMPDNSMISISSFSKPDGFFFGLKPVQPNVTIEGTPFNDFAQTLWLCNGESCTLFYSNNALYLINCNAKLDDVGEMLFKPTPPLYAIRAEGQLVNRNDYPRLWQFVQKRNVQTVNDSQWLTNGNTYRAMYSFGDGQNTFRLPDLRGLFLRAKDNNRGLDVDRSNTTPEGSFQGDELKQHTHKLFGGAGINTSVLGNGVAAFRGDSPSDNNDWNYQITTASGAATRGDSGSTGGNETRPINAAFTIYIRM